MRSTVRPAARARNPAARRLRPGVIPTYHEAVPGALVILRHGESTWNELNLFTGWHDVPLTERGKREAAQAGTTMREEGLHFDVAHTSVLTRAVVTCYLTLEELGQVWLPLQRHWRL